jgi:hypothetical protein
MEANNSKRQRSENGESFPTRTKMKLDPLLAKRLGTKYCFEEELTPLLLAKGLCSRIETFQVKATLIGDKTWMTIDLDSDNATAAELKEQIEKQSGKASNQQELFQCIEGWEQDKSGDFNEDGPSFLPGETIFDGPCSVIVLINEAVDIIIEGNARCEGLYERMEGQSHCARGVWKKQGEIDLYLFYARAVDDADHQKYDDERESYVVDEYQERYVEVNGWMVSNEIGAVVGWLYVESESMTPDEVEGPWYSSRESRWHQCVRDYRRRETPVQTRVCSSVEKRAREEALGKDLVDAKVQAEQMQTIVVTGDGVNADLNVCMGPYELVEGKIVNDRGVWKNESGMFIYYSREHVMNCQEATDENCGRYYDDVDERPLRMIAPGSMADIVGGNPYVDDGGDGRNDIHKLWQDEDEEDIVFVDPHDWHGPGQWTISTEGHLSIAEKGVIKFGDEEDLPSKHGYYNVKMYIQSTALTPVGAGSLEGMGYGGWHQIGYGYADRSLHVDPCESTPAGQQVAAKVLEQTHAARTLVMEGSNGMAGGANVNGVYELAGETMNGRGVWKLSGKDSFLFYHKRTTSWWAAPRSSMDDLSRNALCHVLNTCRSLTPDSAPKGQWTKTAKTPGTYDTGAQAQLRVRVLGAEELHEMQQATAQAGSSAAQ